MAGPTTHIFMKDEAIDMDKNKGKSELAVLAPFALIGLLDTIKGVQSHPDMITEERFNQIKTAFKAYKKIDHNLTLAGEWLKAEEVYFNYIASHGV